MSAALYLLRTFWKPLALLALAAMIYGSGYQKANNKCEASSLKAENAELVRQMSETQTILNKTALAGAARQAEINRLSKEVDTYEARLTKDNRYILFGDDANGLRRVW